MDLNRILQNYMAEIPIQCLSVLVKVKDKTMYKFINGNYTVGSNDVHIDETTKFDIGSVTKPFTASLIIKLIETGEIRPDDKVKKYIPEFMFDDVTIYHLLTHSTGYDENIHIPGPDFENELDIYFKKIYGISSLKNKPGSVSSYATYGYAILMDILQRVTGKTIEKFAKDTLFETLIMKNSTFEIKNLSPYEYVLPYDFTNSVYLEKLRNRPPTGDSELYSTAEDVMHFADMLLQNGSYNNRKIFSKSSLKLMMEEATEGRFMKTLSFWIKGETDRYGCFPENCSKQSLCHTGFSGCMILIDPESGIKAVLLSNSMKLHSDWSQYKSMFQDILNFCK